MICKQCKTEYHRFGSNPPMYCSVKCRAEASKKVRIGRPPKERPLAPMCAMDGCENRVKREWGNYHKYCSPACSNRSRVVKSPSRICEKCGASYSRKNGDSTKVWEARKYCSPRCAGSNDKKKHLGDSNGFFAMSQQEIADRLGISVRRVQQHEAKALEKILNAIMANPKLRDWLEP